MDTKDMLHSPSQIKTKWRIPMTYVHTWQIQRDINKWVESPSQVKLRIRLIYSTTNYTLRHWKQVWPERLIQQDKQHIHQITLSTQTHQSDGRRCSHLQSQIFLGCVRLLIISKYKEQSTSTPFTKSSTQLNSIYLTPSLKKAHKFSTSLTSYGILLCQKFQVLNL